MSDDKEPGAVDFNFPEDREWTEVYPESVWGDENELRDAVRDLIICPACGAVVHRESKTLHKMSHGLSALGVL